MPKPPLDPFEQIGLKLPTFDDDDVATLSLREQAMGDPPRGAPFVIKDDDGEEQAIEPGGWQREGFLDFKTGLPANCPVIPLGQGSNGQIYYFLNTLGVVTTLEPNAGKGHIDSLFAGRPKFLTWGWPRWSAAKGSKIAQVTNWEAETARQDLFAACAYKGTFELEDKVRGRGAWRDDDGSLIYHAGDKVYIGGKWLPPGEHGRFIYPGRPKIGRPERVFEPEGEGSPGDVLLTALHSWHWDRPTLDPLLALGWTMTAMVGGAIEQRPVAYVVGTEGAGKTTLQKLLRWLMNGALVKTSNTTQAGIYQKVRQDSVAVMVDELEAKADTRTTDKILELARIAYSGDKMNRGTQGGEGQEFAVMSSFLFSSIALPAMDAQDASRMAVLLMRERKAPEPGEKAVDVLKELGLRDGSRAQELGRQLLKRAFRWFEMDGNRSNWERLREVMQETLIAAGHSDRSADTFGTLAAGCHIALHDNMPTADQLAEWSSLLKADQLDETSNSSKTWQRCLRHMLDARPQVLATRTHKSAGAVLAAWRDDPNAQGKINDVEDYLPSVGLTVTWSKEDQFEHSWDNARLFVPATSAALHALFEGSPWAGRPATPGPWGGVLRQMPKSLWTNGKCGKGLDLKASGILIDLAKALEA